MQILCMSLVNTQSVLDNVETRLRSCDVGMFLDAASSCLLCPLACWAGSIWVTVCAWRDGTLLCTQGAERTSRSPVDALSSNTKCVRDQHIWNVMHLSSVKMKLLGWGSRLERNKNIGIKKVWNTTNHSLLLHTKFSNFSAFHKVQVTHSTILIGNKEPLKVTFKGEERSTVWGFCSGDVGVAGFPGSPIQILSWNKKDLAFGPAALAGLELGLCFWSHHLFAPGAV